MQNAIAWFEIPAINLDRATKFYEAIMNYRLFPMQMDNFQMRMFPVDDPMNGVGGCLVNVMDNNKPSTTDGVLIYLNANPDLQNVLDRVEAAGGKIVMTKTQISPEHGYMAVINDTEGNRIGLHSNPN